MATHYEMFWDCASCGTKKLLGVTHRHCPNCGSAQDENARYFPAPQQEIALQNHTYYGVDWDCAYCSTPNSNNAAYCVNCGAGRDGTKPVVMVHERSIKKAGQNNSQEIQGDYSSVRETQKSKKYLTLAICSLALLLFAALIVGLTVKTDEEAIVYHKEWSRSIAVEQYSAQRGEDWCSSKPSDAYSVTSSREVRDYKQVADGQSCSTSNVDKGDGSYSKQTTCTTKYKSVPVYDNKCYYTINRWEHARSLVSNGDHSVEPHWSSVGRLTTSALNVLGNERLGSKSERYTVQFKNKKKESDSWTCSFNQNTWNQYTLGSHFKVKVNMFGAADCSSLKNDNHYESNF